MQRHRSRAAYLVKSTSFLPLEAWVLLQISTTACSRSAIFSKSASLRPREVMAGEPMRTPPGVRALTSPTTAFLFSVMWHRSHAFSTLLPVRPCKTEPAEMQCQLSVT